jgi:DNA-binding GntR family transcriptional regulator
MPTPSGVPRYRHLADEIRRRMDRGRLGYRPGDQLESEPTIVQWSGYSRETVRAALKLLRAEGRLRVVLGVGTFVAEREKWQAPSKG